MGDIKVEDLVRSIREQARESAAQQSASSNAPPDGSARSLTRLQTSLTITGRTQDQLPPLTTYRSGSPARLELWIKRQLKRVTHWFTWEQVNFNSSVDSALKNTLAVLQTHEQRLASLQDELDASSGAKANLESQVAELEARLSQVESRFNALLSEKLSELRREHRKAIELLLDEQRISFKQLALEISEAGVIADRTKRSIQLRVDQLAARVDELNAEQHEVKEVGGKAIHEITRNFANES
jgi:outer membrane murein-binding lipoprotein Lpp